MRVIAPDEVHGGIPCEGNGGSHEAGDQDGLSTDYLNHYSEILMLIELAPFDGGVLAELSAWRPMGYRDYFLKSPLRRARAALAAYDALPGERRLAFERNVEALDRLAAGAVLALQPPCHPQNVALIAGMVGPALHRLIARAAAFLNSCGTPPEGCDEPQALIDGVMA